MTFLIKYKKYWCLKKWGLAFNLLAASKWAIYFLQKNKEKWLKKGMPKKVFLVIESLLSKAG